MPVIRGGLAVGIKFTNGAGSKVGRFIDKAPEHNADFAELLTIARLRNADFEQGVPPKAFCLWDKKLAKTPEAFHTFWGIHHDGTRSRFKPPYALILHDVGCASVLMHIPEKNVKGRLVPKGWLCAPTAKLLACDLRFYADKFHIPLESVRQIFKDFAEMGLLRVWLSDNYAKVVINFKAFKILMEADDSCASHKQWVLKGHFPPEGEEFIWVKSATNGGPFL